MSTNAPAQNMTSSRQSISYHTVEIQGLKIFYREAGLANAPTVLLLHGFPSSSRMWEPLLPLLADKYHLIAPDYPGFGNSSAPSPSSFEYTFDNLARVMGELTTKLGITNYVLFMQDYGGPVGFRMALAHPERVRAIIIQNAVSHEQRLSPLWEARRKYWADPAQELDNLKANFTSFEATPDRAPIPIVTIRIRGPTNTPFSPVLAKPRFKPHCSWITGPTLPPTCCGKNGFARCNRRLWWFGENTTPPSPSPARRLMPAMCQRPKSISWKRDISHWMNRLTRSHPWFVISSSAWTRTRTSSRESVRNSKGDWDAYSRASSTVSVTLSDDGQISPDASNRRIVSRTVEGAEPTRHAISRLGIPAAFNSHRIRARGASQASPSASRSPSHKPEGGTISEPEEVVSPRAKSFRNGGRHRAESAFVLPIYPAPAGTAPGIGDGKF